MIAPVPYPSVLLKIKVETDNTALCNEIYTRLDKINEKIDGLRQDVYSYRDSSLKFAIGLIISFLFGGAVC